MTLAQIAGAILVATPLILMFVMMWQTIGLGNAFQVVAGALAITASIVVGGYLLGWE